ncbi:MAG: uroporphyrinogen-III C-methyltransferase [Burkholderiaceae bacterium]
MSNPLESPAPAPAPAESSPPPPVNSAAVAGAPQAAAAAPRAAWIFGGVAAALAVASMALAWQTWQRVQQLEQELVRRQQDSAAQATEARVLAKQAQDVSRDAAAKVALSEARIAENSLQRTQLEELIQSLSRSRDENMLADIDAALRVAVQQASITGSTEPLLATFKQSEERLARNAQPRVERVRRALARDFERVRAVSVADIATLLIKVDDAVRLADELPLLAQPERRPSAASAAAARARAAAAASAPASIPAPAAELPWRQRLAEAWQTFSERVWGETRSLVRVTPIDNPEAMLLSPEQAFFLRENVKLRLLNARLALLSRQYVTVQADLRDVQAALDRYFDRSSRRVQQVGELLRQVSSQARGIVVPRPDETLAALAAAQAGR